MWIHILISVLPVICLRFSFFWWYLLTIFVTHIPFVFSFSNDVFHNYRLPIYPCLVQSRWYKQLVLYKRLIETIMFLKESTLDWAQLTCLDFRPCQKIQFQNEWKKICSIWLGYEFYILKNGDYPSNRWSCQLQPCWCTISMAKRSTVRESRLRGG